MCAFNNQISSTNEHQYRFCQCFHQRDAEVANFNHRKPHEPPKIIRWFGNNGNHEATTESKASGHK